MPIRPATLADFDDLVALEAHFPGDRLSRSSLRRLLSRAHADVWVAEAGGRIVGDAVVLYRRGFMGARLYSLVVHPADRGRGLGRALLEAAEQGALKRGCVSMRLEVREDNRGAIRLYQACGYQEVGHTAEYYHDGSGALRMRKRLKPLPPPTLKRVPYYAQTLEFTCGPAALMMALRYLGHEEEMSRAFELTLWREATTIFMTSGHGGTSAHGLALAALRRGFQARVFSKDSRVPFIDTVRTEEKKEVVALTHQQFVQAFEALGGVTLVQDFGVREVIAALEGGGVPIVLVNGQPLYGEKVPHWMVVTGFDATFLYLHDPEVPADTQRADSVHLPLPQREFARLSRYGKEERYMVVVRR